MRAAPKSGCPTPPSDHEEFEEKQVARESTVVFKGIKPFSERYPEAGKEFAADLRELKIRPVPD